MAVSLEEWKVRVGEDLGASDWLLIDQPMIDAFADITRDHQFIHVDLERAEKTPFGGTIAHGYLTLSMLSSFAYEVLPAIDGVIMGVNYGMNRLRFLAPVRAGSRIRGRFLLKECSEKVPGQIINIYDVTVEIEDEDRPALVAEWVTMAFF